MMVTFAGSTHTKYATYLLEMISNLELESSPVLRETLLFALLVNPTGLAGGFQLGDIYQEKLNRCIEPIIQRKDTDFGSYHVRHLWSRNINDIYELKADFRTGVGLAKRSGRHKEPHEKSEFKTLLKEYKNEELHLRRPGRMIGTEVRDVDDLGKGIRALGGGFLNKWVR